MEQDNLDQTKKDIRKILRPGKGNIDCNKLGLPRNKCLSQNMGEGEADFAQSYFQGVTYDSLQEFDPLSLVTEDGEPDAAIAFLGQRRTGKSFAARAIIYALREHLPCGVVLTNTKFNGFWQKHMPEKSVIPLKHLDETLAAVFRRQERLRAARDAKKLPDGLNPWMFIILDDWVTDVKNARHNPDVNRLFMEGRHLLIFVIAISQYPKAIGTYIRNNADYVFIFRQNSAVQEASLWEDHMGFTDKKFGLNLLRQATMKQKHQCFVINKQPHWSGANEVFFKYTAPDVPETEKLGCPDWNAKQTQPVESEQDQEVIRRIISKASNFELF